MSFLSTCIYLGLSKTTFKRTNNFSFHINTSFLTWRFLRLISFPYLGIFFAVALISGVEAESWIMNDSYKTCRNHESLFLKLGNHESLYFGSEITNNESLRKAQQNRYELIAFDPGIAGYGVSASQNLNCFFSGGACPWTPLYNSCVRGW